MVLGNGGWWWLHNHVNVVNATELYAQKKIKMVHYMLYKLPQFYKRRNGKGDGITEWTRCLSSHRKPIFSMSSMYLSCPVSWQLLSLLPQRLCTSSLPILCLFSGWCKTQTSVSPGSLLRSWGKHSWEQSHWRSTPQRLSTLPLAIKGATSFRNARLSAGVCIAGSPSWEEYAGNVKKKKCRN